MEKAAIGKLLSEAYSDKPVSRAEMTRTLVRTVCDFFKFHRPEGGGLDGRDGTERQGLAKIVDATEDHYYAMLSEKHIRKGASKS